MLKKRRKRKTKQNKTPSKNYKIYQKDKIKNLEQSLEFQKYNVKEKKEKKERKKSKQKQSRKNYKENIGTKLITNTKIACPSFSSFLR